MKKLLYALVALFGIAILTLTFVRCDGGGCKEGEEGCVPPPPKDTLMKFVPPVQAWGVNSDFVANYASNVTAFIDQVTLPSGEEEAQFEGDVNLTTSRKGTTLQYYYYFSKEDQLMKSVAVMHEIYWHQMFKQAEVVGAYIGKAEDGIGELFRDEPTNSMIDLRIGGDPRNGGEYLIATFTPIISPVGLELEFEEPLQASGLSVGAFKEALTEAGYDVAKLVSGPAGSGYYGYPGSGSVDNFAYRFFNGNMLYQAASLMDVLYTAQVKAHLHATYPFLGTKPMSNLTTGMNAMADMFQNDDKMSIIYVYIDDSAPGQMPLLFVEFHEFEWVEEE